MEGQGHCRYSFHLDDSGIPYQLQYYRQHQQDALQHSWMDLSQELMGALIKRQD
jgi:hypothetical protein